MPPSNKPEQPHTEGAQAEPWFAYASEQPKVGSEGKRWTIYKSGLPEREDSFVEGPATPGDPPGEIEVVPAVEVERLREALKTELPILERLGGSTTPKEATQAAARLRAALHPDEGPS